MPLLIDGYNLLHGSGVFGDGSGRTPLEDARTALLAFLVDALEPAELRGSAIVFDAQTAPPGLPRGYSYHGLAVHFAPRGCEADEVLEELIAADHAPRSLIVVSSDHRVQRAAKRRKATAIDSDRWYRETVAAQHQRRSAAKPAPAAEASQGVTPSSAEVRRWLAEFGLTEEDVAELELELAGGEAAAEPPTETTNDGDSNGLTIRSTSPKRKISRKIGAPAKPKAPKSRAKKAAPRQKPSAKEIRKLDLRNPFPPGYGHDVLEEENDKR